MGQPRNAIIGHIISAFVGIVVAKLFGLDASYDDYRWLAAPLSCGIASAAMTLTNTIHPPGGATAVLAVADPTIHALGWMFLPLVLIACLLMLSVALVTNNIQRRYPVWWWTPLETGAVWKRKAIEDVEKFISSSSHTLTESHTTLESGPALPVDDAIVLSGEGFIRIPVGFELNERECAVLETLLAKLQAPHLERTLSEMSWIDPSPKAE